MSERKPHQNDSIVKPANNHEKAKKWAVILAVAAFAVASGWNVATRINIQKSNSASIDQVIETIEEACVNRRALTVQYRVRGKNQRIMARAQLLTTRAFLIALEESPPPPGTTQKELEIRARFIEEYEAAIPKLKHILKTTKLLPLENCTKQAQELREKQPAG